MAGAGVHGLGGEALGEIESIAAEGIRCSVQVLVEHAARKEVVFR